MLESYSMVEHRTLPKEMIIDGKPYWEHLGGSTVMLLGSTAKLISSVYEEEMRKEGHFITDVLDRVSSFEKVIPNLYEGELGVVVVDGPFDRNPHGRDMAKFVPTMLADMGRQAPTIYVPGLKKINEREKDELIEMGYTAVVEHDYSPRQIIVNAAKKVTELVGVHL